MTEAPDLMRYQLVSLGKDPVGDLLYSDHQPDRFFRRINDDFREHVERLVRHPRFPDIVKAGLVNTTISDQTVSGGPLILEHPLIDPVTFPHEWSREQFRQAAEMIARINQLLLQIGYFTQDHHLLNIVFARSGPVLVDIGYIVERPKRLLRSWMERFDRVFTLPVAASAFVDEQAIRTGRRLNPKYGSPELEHIQAGSAERPRGPALAALRLPTVRTMARARLRLAFSRRLPIRLGEQFWFTSTLAELGRAKAHATRSVSVSPDAGLERLADFTRTVAPQSFLAYAGNAAAMDRLYVSPAGIRPTLAILHREEATPAAADRGAFIVDYHSFNNPTWHVAERFRSELVLAFDLVDHLVTSEQQTFKSVLNTLGRLSEKWLIVDFVERKDRGAEVSLQTFLSTADVTFHERGVFGRSEGDRYFVVLEHRTPSTPRLHPGAITHKVLTALLDSGRY